ncbi:MAG TPA: agmatinase [Syntrophorhabdaceae bacterium]|nr:agmatinase [Syntrophorhabdaceae bacterium]
MAESYPRFCDLPDRFADYGTASIVVLPIPFDKTSTWMKGADKGPRALIEASRYLEFYDIETETEVYRKGIFTAPPIRAGSSSALLKQTETSISKFLKDGKFVVSLGGEHSVSIGVIKPHAAHFTDLSVLHLDAHADSRDVYEGSRYNHACVVARVREFVENVVSVGVRSMDAGERSGLDPRKMFFAHDICRSDKWMQKVTRELTANVYITIDVDVFDPGIMPSTGTPEPGGLDWYTVLRLLFAVTRAKNVVGFDVVELCPSNHKASDFLASKLTYTLLSYIFKS